MLSLPNQAENLRPPFFNSWSLSPGAMPFKCLVFIWLITEVQKKMLTDTNWASYGNDDVEGKGTSVARGGPGVPVTPPFASLF